MFTEVIVIVLVFSDFVCVILKIGKVICWGNSDDGKMVVFSVLI